LVALTKARFFETAVAAKVAWFPVVDGVAWRAVSEAMLKSFDLKWNDLMQKL
jgi:hypothetical protein